MTFLKTLCSKLGNVFLQIRGKHFLVASKAGNNHALASSYVLGDWGSSWNLIAFIFSVFLEQGH